MEHSNMEKHSLSHQSGKILFIIVLLFATALSLSACGGDDEEKSDTEETGQEVASDDSTTEESGSSDGEEGVPGEEATLPPQEAADIVIDAPDSNELYAGIDELMDGEALYVTLCSKCHGLEGFGDGPSSGSLNPQGNMSLILIQDKTDEELLESINLGKGVDMPPWGLLLTQEQQEIVLAHIRTLAE